MPRIQKKRFSSSTIFERQRNSVRIRIISTRTRSASTHRPSPLLTLFKRSSDKSYSWSDSSCCLLPTGGEAWNSASLFFRTLLRGQPVVLRLSRFAVGGVGAVFAWLDLLSMLAILAEIRDPNSWNAASEFSLSNVTNMTFNQCFELFWLFGGSQYHHLFTYVRLLVYYIV